MKINKSADVNHLVITFNLWLKLPVSLGRLTTVNAFVLHDAIHLCVTFSNKEIALLANKTCEVN